ncbi:hypothetical protein C1I97_19965 [Streptomyces sp. NTH33]|nr:hypothetical protein C1I97_19965 [Streptomyces sp. NTH33]
MVLAVMVWGASSASAGGPTSVLVTSPSSAKATGLYHSDKDYLALEQLLGPLGSGGPKAPSEADLANARQINATWLIHDITVWRLDRIFPLTDKNAVWIHTAAHASDSRDSNWHLAQQPDQLRTLLKKLDMMRKPSDSGHSGIFPVPSEGDAATADTAAPDADTGTQTVQVSAPTTGGDGTDWWWALPGAAAGALLALVLRPFASRLPLDRLRRERDPGPRQELRDV